MAHIAKCESPIRFSSLAFWWRDNRFDGDEDIYAELEAWRKEDTRMWQRSLGTKRHALGRRKDEYQKLACQLANNYDTLVLEDIDLRVNKTIPKPESERKTNKYSRSQQVLTAPSQLRLVLEHAFQLRGGQIFYVPASKSAKKMLELWERGEGKEKVKKQVVSDRMKRLRGVREEEPDAA